MRFSMAWTSVSAPSAVCATEMPSWALRVACLSPEIWARRFWEMTRPAASSAARLMRNPEESFSRLLPIEVFVLDRLRQALKAATLLLIRMVVQSSVIGCGGAATLLVAVAGSGRVGR